MELGNKKVDWPTRPIDFLERVINLTGEHPMILNEVAPNTPEAEAWILANKQKFKDRYGPNWEKVLYAKAWKLFSPKHESYHAFYHSPYSKEQPYQGILLSEGLISVLKNIATGNIEEEVEEIEKEARDIKTPEQQRIVLIKILRVMEKLVQLRHNPGWIAKTYHNGIAWFAKALGGSNASNNIREISTRANEQIAKLARIRDQVLAKKWEDDDKNKKLEELKGKLKDILVKASTKSPYDE
jgi:hypothetical protein